MRSFVLLASLALLVVVSIRATATAAGRSVDAGTARLRVTVRPAVVDLYGQSTIAVSGLSSRSLRVRLTGANYADGATGWRALRLTGHTWRGKLPTPALHGLYLIELRTATDAPVVNSHLFLSVFEPGTRARPSFKNPAEVARWWVRAIPRAKLVALKAWALPSFDRRDPRLHRLFVVSYSPAGHSRVSDRLGMFVTAVRDGYHGDWRLLEATVEP
jgi:hypothetical protein